MTKGGPVGAANHETFGHQQKEMVRPPGPLFSGSWIDLEALASPS